MAGGQVSLTTVKTIRVHNRALIVPIANNAARYERRSSRPYEGKRFLANAEGALTRGKARDRSPISRVLSISLEQNARSWLIEH